MIASWQELTDRVKLALEMAGYVVEHAPYSDSKLYVCPPSWDRTGRWIPVWVGAFPEVSSCGDNDPDAAVLRQLVTDIYRHLLEETCVHEYRL
jgi:hypothetical protein